MPQFPTEQPPLHQGREGFGAVADSERLGGLVLEVLRDVDFTSVIDLGKRVSGVPAPTVTQTPHVDLAVIELDSMGQATSAANVQQSRDFPGCRAVTLGPDLRSMHTDFRAWDLARWEDATTNQFSTTPYPDGSALVPGVSGQPFMAPYPASTFKLLVAVQVLRQVDAGRLSLAERTVNLAPGAEGIEGETLPTQGAECTVAEALDAMITSSDNSATCLLLQQLHVLHQLEPGSNELNRTFAQLGMATLQVNGTDAATGTRWGVGSIHMTAMDTARLLLLLQGGHLSFREHGGVGASELLTTPSRQRLLSLLEQQGFHDVLSTTNWCGRSYPGPGIPAQVPARWIGADGTVTVGQTPFGQDVRPCNMAAQVSFAHKTGLTQNYGSDAGIVTALPGQDGRRYIVVVFSNVGSRYSDASQAVGPSPAPAGVSVAYSQKFAQLGKAIDDLLRRD